MPTTSRKQPPIAVELEKLFKPTPPPRTTLPPSAPPSYSQEMPLQHPFNPSKWPSPTTLYESISMEPKHPYRWTFRLGLVELLLGLVGFAAAVTCVVETPYCPLYAGVWASILFILGATLSIAAAKWGTTNLFVSHLVIAVLSVVAAIILVVSSTVNWQKMGEEMEEDAVPDCILSSYNYERLLEISKSGNFDFARCVWEMKLGISMNSVLLLIGSLQGCLSFGSFLVSCRRVCTKDICSCPWKRSRREKN